MADQLDLFTEPKTAVPLTEADQLRALLFSICCTHPDLRQWITEKLNTISKATAPDPEIYTWNSVVANGLLQEVNRRFLHPLGFSLTLSFNEDTGNYESPVIMYTKDEEGWNFDKINPSLVAAFDIITTLRHRRRQDKIGWIIQQ